MQTASYKHFHADSTSTHSCYSVHAASCFMTGAHTHSHTHMHTELIQQAQLLHTGLKQWHVGQHSL